ncbi:MAG: protein-disulfide isomerase [SAR86 cluster bacterium]|uniref:Thiol:disulfide interchange protein n=1 Tax=SAR86 cluster bacterium TaxID=2030880 RepID=A0A2A5CDK3_9GAMM|nr:MAG: protein-disulfide isomerase [SAR86 cluster bacterium]
MSVNLPEILFGKVSKIRIAAISLSLLFLPFSEIVLAQGLSSSQIDDTPEVAAIRSVLLETQPTINIQSIVSSPVDGLFEVRMQNGQAIFASADAQYFLPSDLYQATSDGLVNLGEGRRNDIRLDLISTVDEADMIIYPAEGEVKATLTVFTDVDCPYCQRLHSEVSQLNEYGITIRYLAFPRSGLDEVTYPKMVSTWCAENRNLIFTTVSRGAAIPETDCVNPVANQYQLGRLVGVTGTPTLVFEDGSILPGYVPADDLAAFLFEDE